MKPIDLRSDTVTRPTEGMRRAMADAAVGDDVYGEDPTANRFEARVAALLGKEDSVFVPTGTMANQIALQLHLRVGDEVLVGRDAHVFLFEVGGGSAFAGAHIVQLPGDGTFGADAVRAAIKPNLTFFPETRLIAIENTHNVSGGRVFPQSDVVAVAELAHGRGIAVHLDGARIWNAAVATEKSVAELCAPADTVSACFSKGLGAPVGSVLAGTKADMHRARRARRRMGGGMRQVGVLCAAASYALDHHLERLAADHENAQTLARGLAEAEGITCDPAAVETNIVNFDVADAASVVARAAEHGVLVNAIADAKIRAVTHLDVSAEQCAQAVQILSRIAAG